MRTRRIHARNGGFSLIELMVVIAIMGLLATVVTVGLSKHVGVARMTKVCADFDSIKKGVELFHISTGHYPTRFEELWMPPSGQAKWKGPYLEDVPPTPKDPWGREYFYTPPTSSNDYLISSYGPDGEGSGQVLTNRNIRAILDSKDG